MKINHKILSIPPYVSTSWTNVASLHVESQNEQLLLVIGLNGGSRVEIPSLDFIVIEAIFAAHAKFMELEQLASSTPSKAQLKSPSELNLGAVMGEANQGIFGFALPTGNVSIENFGNMLQHNSDEADCPDLPQEVLNKISMISKTMGINDPNVLPKAEPHCNCMHCQIARAIQEGALIKALSLEQDASEEDVSDEDLKFRIWDISQTSEKLYLVSNPENSKEQFSVYLGDPLGCTCGEKNCEHIKAVLSS